MPSRSALAPLSLRESGGPKTPLATLEHGTYGVLANWREAHETLWAIVALCSRSGLCPLPSVSFGTQAWDEAKTPSSHADPVGIWGKKAIVALKP